MSTMANPTASLCQLAALSTLTISSATTSNSPHPPHVPSSPSLHISDTRREKPFPITAMYSEVED